jgi:3-oxoacyl-[acyl-carrier protein] reductase
MTVKSKVAVITGGGTGIGKQMAFLFAREGADVVVLGRVADELEVVRKEVQALSRRCLAYKVNVADETQVNAAIEASLKTLGRIDVLINNAATLGPTAPVAQTSTQSWTEEIAVNLTGSFLCCRAVLPGMMERKSGKIINITSVASAPTL